MQWWFWCYRCSYYHVLIDNCSSAIFSFFLFILFFSFSLRFMTSSKALKLNWILVYYVHKRFHLSRSISCSLVLFKIYNSRMFYQWLEWEKNRLKKRCGTIKISLRESKAFFIYHRLNVNLNIFMHFLYGEGN